MHRIKVKLICWIMAHGDHLGWRNAVRMLSLLDMLLPHRGPWRFDPNDDRLSFGSENLD